MKPTVLCPAGAEAHPVLSRNLLDVNCRVQGNLRPAATRDADGSVRLAVCCDNYVDCPVWRVHKEVTRTDASSTKRQRDAAVSPQRPHVLSGAVRDRVAVD